jgi:hypothetical protein
MAETKSAILLSYKTLYDFFRHIFINFSSKILPASSCLVQLNPVLFRGHIRGQNAKSWNSVICNSSKKLLTTFRSITPGIRLRLAHYFLGWRNKLL